MFTMGEAAKSKDHGQVASGVFCVAKSLIVSTSVLPLKCTVMDSSRRVASLFAPL